MAKKKTDQTEAAAQAAVLRISARREGFRRAGRVWGTSPVEIARDEFTAGQIEALMDDPMLTIEEVAG